MCRIFKSNPKPRLIRLPTTDEIPDLTASIARSYPDPNGEIDRWVRKFLHAGRPTPTGSLLMTLTRAISESFTYRRRTERGTQGPVATLRIGHGSCRDFAVLMMEAVRSLGLAARFVSGYLYVPSRDGPEYLGGGSTHAWCQVYLPGAGWVEFDPTNGIIGNRDLIRVAVARDPGQAVPLSGTYMGNVEDELDMRVEVNVKSEDGCRNIDGFGGLTVTNEAAAAIPAEAIWRTRLVLRLGVWSVVLGARAVASLNPAIRYRLCRWKSAFGNVAIRAYCRAPAYTHVVVTRAGVPRRPSTPDTLVVANARAAEPTLAAPCRRRSGHARTSIAT